MADNDDDPNATSGADQRSHDNTLRFPRPTKAEALHRYAQARTTAERCRALMAVVCARLDEQGRRL